MQAHNKYVFLVKLEATKPEVKKAVEVLYGVKVADVNMIITYSRATRYGAKIRTKKEYKKAIVTLKEGEKIDTAITK